MTHIPVLLKELIEILDPKPGEFFIDGTVGRAGHSLEILRRIGPNGKLLGVDWDRNAIERLKIEKLKDFKNVVLVNGNYTDLPEILEKENLPLADGLIIDLGFSSDQLESSGRGFSFKKNEPLIMRYSSRTIADLTQTNTEKSQYKSVPNQRESVLMTAAEVVNAFSEKDLADIFFKYGEERHSRRIAKKIVEERRKQRILTTFQLIEIINKSYKSNKVYKIDRTYARIFQALRIYVNCELENLETLLKNLKKILKPKGRAAIISFNSLEDRLVKNYFRAMAKEGKAEILTKKPIRASEKEIKENSRSRSAKMRAVKLR